MRRLAAAAAVLLLAATAAAQAEGPEDVAFLKELRADFLRGGTWAAQRDLDQYLLDYPASPEARRLAAEVALQRGQVAQAEAHLRAGGWPDEALHGQLLLRLGHYEEALELARGGRLPGLAGDWLAVQALDGLGRRVEALQLAAARAGAVDDRTLDGRGLLDLGRLLLFVRKHELANQALVFADAELNGKQGPGYHLTELQAPLLLAQVRIETRQGGSEGADPVLRLLQEVLEIDAGLPEALVLKARELGLAGATVWRGIEGYGAASRIHTAKILRLSEDLPVLIEIVDLEEKIRQALPHLDAMMEAAGGGGLITLEKAEIIKYTHGR